MTKREVLTGAALLALSACGGGGDSGPQPEPPPAQGAPRFTSVLALNVAENAAAGRTIYQAIATDPNNDALTFSISGGADAARFGITAAGELSFAAVPDFETPADANRDNSYEVTLQVSDGRLTDTLSLLVTVTNVAGESFSVRRVASGLAQPLYVAPVPGDARVFVLEKGGRVLLLDPATGASSTYLNLAATISTDGERGLLGLAPAPDYAQSGLTYIYVTNPQGDIEIRRYRRLDANRGDPASGDVILSIPHREFNNHNGGWLGFGPDGLLHILTGDGGGSGDPLNNAQNLRSLLGKLLRIDVGRDAFPDDPSRDYAIPADNGAAPGNAGEVAAYGLRNPFRASFDGPNLLIGDVGQNAREEVDLFRPQDPGVNYGWPVREGTREFRGGPILGITPPPVLEYEHGSGPLQGRSVTGGYVYRGPVLALQSQYVFGDFVTGNIWTVPAADLVQTTTLTASRFTRRNGDFQPDAGAFNNIASFGEDAQRNLYIVDFDGEIFQIRAGS